MILDRFGNPIPHERVRPAIGFTERVVSADESETLNGITHDGRREWEATEVIEFTRKEKPWRS